MTYAVCVTFLIQPDQMASFMPLMIANAKASLNTEEGCQRFDVLTDPSRPNEVFLYELYDTPAAFQLHLASDHFQTFDDAVASMILGKDVKLYTQVVS